MAEAMTLRVLTDAGLAIEDEAVSVIAPGEVGYLGMLRNHAPLITTLGSGTLTWRTPRGERRLIRIGPGLLEVQKNQVTVLTDYVAEAGPRQGERP
jgi:F-type H+-transporting ATPase subunit epsilon